MRSTADTQAFKEALVAAARGPFFPDWEFQTLFGLKRYEVARIAEAFSSATPLTGNVSLAVNNAVQTFSGTRMGTMRLGRNGCLLRPGSWRRPCNAGRS